MYSSDIAALQNNTQFQTPQVAHLAWSLTSPSLVAAYLDNDFDTLLTHSQQHDIEWLRKLDLQPSNLLDYLSTHNQRLLGSYFECLWQFYFSHHPDWQLLEHHVQVFDTTNKQTLGELDLLVQHTPSQQYFHIELAAKFYLRHPEKIGLNEDHWLGPQTNDRLDLKLDKLYKKQLPFLHHEATQISLVDRQLDHPYKQALIMKGYLFHPWQQGKTLTDSTNKAVLNGRWLHEKDFEHLRLKNKDQLWAILPKHNWLGPFNGQHIDSLISNGDTISEAISLHFKESPYKHALMLVMLTSSEKGLIESQRFMLVHNEWPNKEPS